jgi:hypothetical protein
MSEDTYNIDPRAALTLSAVAGTGIGFLTSVLLTRRKRRNKQTLNHHMAISKFGSSIIVKHNSQYSRWILLCFAALGFSAGYTFNIIMTHK